LDKKAFKQRWVELHTELINIQDKEWDSGLTAEEQQRVRYLDLLLGELLEEFARSQSGPSREC
jgi:hypothetical protein